MNSLSRDQVATLSKAFTDGAGIAPMRWRETIVIAIIFWGVVALIIASLNGGTGL